MNFARKVELIAWLIAVVPEKYLPLSIREMTRQVQCGSLDCVDEVISAYIQGDSFLGNDFNIMTREQVLEYADKHKESKLGKPMVCGHCKKECWSCATFGRETPIKVCEDCLKRAYVETVGKHQFELREGILNATTYAEQAKFICSCGHAMTRHIDNTDECFVMDCDCSYFSPNHKES